MALGTWSTALDARNPPQLLRRMPEYAAGSRAGPDAPLPPPAAADGQAAGAQVEAEAEGPVGLAWRLLLAEVAALRGGAESLLAPHCADLLRVRRRLRSCFQPCGEEAAMEAVASEAGWLFGWLRHAHAGGLTHGIAAACRASRSASLCGRRAS